MQNEMKSLHSNREKAVAAIYLIDTDLILNKSLGGVVVPKKFAKR